MSINIICPSPSHPEVGWRHENVGTTIVPIRSESFHLSIMRLYRNGVSHLLIITPPQQKEEGLRGKLKI